MKFKIYMYENDIINYILNDLERFENLSESEKEFYREYLYMQDFEDENISDYADQLFYSTALYTQEEKEIYKADFDGETVLFEYGKYILITR